MEAQIQQAICDAVWARQIDQMATAVVAAQFGIEQKEALRILKKIAAGRANDARFVYDNDRQGVRISDGSIFTYSPMDIDGLSMSTNKKALKHYIWFCS